MACGSSSVESVRLSIRKVGVQLPAPALERRLPCNHLRESALTLSILRVKIKSLAAEAKIIRHEKRRAKDPAHKSELHWHNVFVVRRAARTAQLTYAYLRGVPYAKVERTPKSCEIHEIEKLIRKYAQPPWKDGEGKLAILGWIGGKLSAMDKGANVERSA